MLQIQIIKGDSPEELTKKANEFLATIDGDAVKDLNISPFGECVIQYVIKEAHVGRMCCECQYWDDGGETTTSGLCHEHGRRCRFNCKACTSFKDVRR